MNDLGHDNHSTESPFNAIPLVPLALVAIIITFELTLTVAANGWVGGFQGVGWRAGAFGKFQFYPEVITEIFERGRGSFDYWKRFVTYPFIHSSLTHAVWVCVLLLALGKFVGEIFSSVAFLVLFFATSILGAVIYGVLS